MSSVHVIQRVEEVVAELELGTLGHVEFPRQGNVRRLQAGSDHRVVSHVAEGERRRRRELFQELRIAKEILLVVKLRGQPQATIAFFEIDDIAAFTARKSAANNSSKAAAAAAVGGTLKSPPAGL